MRKEENRREKNRRGRSLCEDLPTQDHDKITLQDPAQKDHIAFVQHSGHVTPLCEFSVSFYKIHSI